MKKRIIRGVIIAFVMSLITLGLLSYKSPQQLTIDEKGVSAGGWDLQLLLRQKGVVFALEYIKGKGCHFKAHQLGYMSYEELGDEIFKLSPDELSSCKYGWYHGAVEGFFSENGTKNFVDDLEIVCPNPAYAVDCYHGVGHGLMAFSHFDLLEALKDCDLIANSTNRSQCWSGAFMENAVGLLHDSDDKRVRYLSDDPQFPCNFVEEKYKATCYKYQPYRMLALSSTGLTGAEKNCRQAPLQHQKVCLEWLRGIMEGTGALVAACDTLESLDSKRTCILGIVGSISKVSKAVDFCNAVDDNYKKDCCKIAKC